jgi:hypothetical protein
MKKNDIVRDNSKNKLKSNVGTRIKTTMIGSISNIEKVFGYLWCHECESRTPEEEEFYRLFTELRNKILDDGNFQIRSFENDLQAYDIEWIGYHLEIPLARRGN